MVREQHKGKGQQGKIRGNHPPKKERVDDLPARAEEERIFCCRTSERARISLVLALKLNPYLQVPGEYSQVMSAILQSETLNG